MIRHKRICQGIPKKNDRAAVARAEVQAVFNKLLDEKEESLPSSSSCVGIDALLEAANMQSSRPL